MAAPALANIGRVTTIVNVASDVPELTATPQDRGNADD
jgi:hypothetical protein